MNITEFFTWQTLATCAGAAMATGLLTQWLKSIGVLSKIPTQIISYVIALVVLFVATAAVSGFGVDWTVWAIIPINAVIVSLAANGAYAGVKRITDGKKE